MDPAPPSSLSSEPFPTPRLSRCQAEDHSRHAARRPTFEVAADGRVPSGIDGEATALEPPLRFRIRLRVLLVRIARRHPGASPSARAPDRLLGTIAALTAIAAGRLAAPPAAVAA